MKIFILVITSLLIPSLVYSKKAKTPTLYNVTKVKYLRQTDSGFSWEDSKDSEDSEEKVLRVRSKGTRITKFLHLQGDIREKFAYEVAILGEKVSVICSPFSALMPLGMLLIGAGNKNTENELKRATGSKWGGSHAKTYFKNLRNLIRNLKEVTTHLASHIFVHEPIGVTKRYKSDASPAFGDCVSIVDMARPQSVADLINRWVEHHTHGKITDIVAPPDISPFTTVMIADTLYFLGTWKYRFDYSMPDKFYGATGEIEINMMVKGHNLLYGTSDVLNAEVLELPYKGGSASMLILLPRERNGLKSLLYQLKRSPNLINQIKTRNVFVAVNLPKFRIETTLDLGTIYKQVGLHEIFVGGSGITNLANRKVNVDKAVQKTVIEVNEMGTMAAAASVVGGLGAPMPVTKPIMFRADHPFLFFIYSNGEQLFAGTFVG